MCQRKVSVSPQTYKRSPSDAASRHQMRLALMSGNLRGQKQRGSEIKTRNPEKMIRADLPAGGGCLSPPAPARQKRFIIKSEKSSLQVLASELVNMLNCVGLLQHFTGLSAGLFWLDPLYPRLE